MLSEAPTAFHSLHTPRSPAPPHPIAPCRSRGACYMRSSTSKPREPKPKVPTTTCIGSCANFRPCLSPLTGHYLYWFAQHPEREPAIRSNSADRAPPRPPAETRPLQAVRRCRCPYLPPAPADSLRSYAPVPLASTERLADGHVLSTDRRPVDGVYLSMGRRITRLSIRSTNGRRTFSLSRIQVVQHH